MRIQDPGWKKFGFGNPGWKKFGSGIWDKHPGSATLVFLPKVGIFLLFRELVAAFGLGASPQELASYRRKQCTS
jgi:hypothetical protein